MFVYPRACRCFLVSVADPGNPGGCGRGTDQGRESHERCREGGVDGDGAVACFEPLKIPSLIGYDEDYIYVLSGLMDHYYWGLCLNKNGILLSHYYTIVGSYS